jgi:RNA polymerase sigma-70 factor (ECF subfamily)
VPDEKGLVEPYASARDDETARWVRELADEGTVRDRAVERLHELLLRVSYAEIRRRGGTPSVTGPELDDLAYQAAGDAVLAITAKLSQFRGESRFTTWAYRFVILEVSSKLGRHFWQRARVELDGEDWEHLPDRFGVDPEDLALRSELIDAVSNAVDNELSEHQRRVFVAIVVDRVPAEALAISLGSNRNALYKTIFDARRKLRAALAEKGYLDASQEGGGPENVSTGVSE